MSFCIQSIFVLSGTDTPNNVMCCPYIGVTVEKKLERHQKMSVHQRRIELLNLTPYDPNVDKFFREFQAIETIGDRVCMHH